MFTLKVKDEIFTIPKQNLRFLAMGKALDLKVKVKLNTDEDAIKFLNQLGIEVLE